MIIKSAEFMMSSVNAAACPPPTLPEYAFIGRSNVGKSSLINMLTNKKELAHTSSKPGKTQLINHFIINENWHLVDLPGYGYAALSKETKKGFETFIKEYLLVRRNLMCVFLLIDSRLPMQANDKVFMEWLATNQIAFVLVFTKTDKLGKTKLSEHVEGYKQALSESWETIPTYFLTSAEKKTGAEEILDYIEQANKLFTFS